MKSVWIERGAEYRELANHVSGFFSMNLYSIAFALMIYLFQFYLKIFSRQIKLLNVKCRNLSYILRLGRNQCDSNTNTTPLIRLMTFILLRYIAMPG